MQGKDASEQKTECKSSAGIDVCKNWLDAAPCPQGCRLRVGNDAQGTANSSVADEAWT